MAPDPGRPSGRDHEAGRGSAQHALQRRVDERAALDALRDGSERYHVKPAWQAELAKVSEGNQATLGAYNRPWR